MDFKDYKCLRTATEVILHSSYFNPRAWAQPRDTTGDKQQQGFPQQPLPSGSPSTTITMRLLKAHAIPFTWGQFLNVTWQLLSDHPRLLLWYLTPSEC